MNKKRMNLRSSNELSRLLSTCLSPVSPLLKPSSLHSLCLRTAAIYATTALYEFHDKQNNGGGLNNVNEGNDGVDTANINETMWDLVFPLLDAHFLRLVPAHLYEQFLDNVLCALEVAAHYDANGKNLMQYVILFFPPRSMRRFKARRCYKDRVLMPTVCCLHKCVNLEELYLEKADSPAITTYLLAHILKFLNRLRVLALPKQCDDDVASVIGLNCPRLECIVLTGTSVSNVGLSWLLCCRQLHTVIMPGFFQGVTPKGVALLLNGLPGLRHVVYDVMSDVLTYVDFNTSAAVLPRLALRTVLFHSMELLSSNHLELVTKLCPNVEWLSLDSALFYNLEGLSRMPQLRLLRLNYKGRPIDDTVVDFFSVSCDNLITLQLFEVKDLSVDDLRLTVGQCSQLETLVFHDCSVLVDWRAPNHGSQVKVISRSVDHLQLFGLQIQPAQLVDFVSLFRDLHILEMDRCDLDVGQVKSILLDQPVLHTLRCSHWTHSSIQRAGGMANLQTDFRNCRLQINKQSFAAYDEEQDSHDRRTMAVKILDEYAAFAPVLSHEFHS